MEAQRVKPGRVGCWGFDLSGHGLGERLLEIGNDVFDSLEAHRQPHHLRLHAASELRLRVHLRVRRRRRVNRKRARVTHIRHMRDEVERVDEHLPRLLAVRGLDAKNHHRAALALEILLRFSVLRIAWEARVAHPLNRRVLRQVLSNLHRVVAVLLHAKRKRLDALYDDPRVVGRDAPAEVAQRHRQSAELESQRSQRLGEVVAPAKAGLAAVRLVRGVVQWVLASPPRETALVDDDPAEARAMAANPLSQGRANNVRAMLEGLAQVGRREGRVHDQRQAEAVGQRRDLLEVTDLESWVRAGLAEECAGLVIGGVCEVLRRLCVHELDGDAELRKDVIELRVGAAVERSGGNDVVAGLRHIDDRVEDGVGPRSHREAGERMAALKLSVARLEDMGGRVHEARVDIAELGKAEEICRVLGVDKLVRRGAVEGDAAGRALAEAIGH
mmetsp:Transcript_48830/g.110808  ORF Transcript_48830/g.110808 Transcript_48830/m.110808 type:complete len:444 (-) Transcript_48830:800-2131(-)